MTRKKWRIRRMLLVPANWQGTPQYFYHFLLGYFMPIVLWQERTGTMEFTVRDCGPMNPWFELLRPDTDVEQIPPGMMLQRVLSHRQERQIFHGWDDPTRFHRRSFEELSSAVHPRIDRAAPTAGSARPRITMLFRAPSMEFYRSEASETHGSGADWRSIPNAAEIADELGRLGDVNLLDTASLSPAQQVAALSATDILVGQHGAGLVNMIWMPPGSAVVEIKPPLIPTVNEIYANLASSKGFDHVGIDQKDDHAAVEVKAVASAVTAVIESPQSFVPPMPGRFPIRVLRQLPRRL